MKKYIQFAAVFLFLPCFFPAACGAKEAVAEEITWQGIASGMEDLTDITERKEFYDVTVESENLFDFSMKEAMPQGIQTALSIISREGSAWVPMGTQFLQGEPIQLWAEIGTELCDLYLYRNDGSRELLLEGFSSEFINPIQPYQWYLDQEGNFYCYGTIYSAPEVSDSEGFLVKILPSGEILYKATVENIHISDLCQTEDGRIYLLLNDLSDGVQGKWMLAEMDSATGKPIQESIRELPLKYGMHLGKTGSFPAVAGYFVSTDRRISRVDMAEGSLSPILFFNGISYGWHEDLELQDFQVAEDGTIELLWSESKGAGGLLEKLKMEKVEKIPVIIRGRLLSSDTWFGNKVAQFNMKNNTYHVIVEDCGSGNDEEDFARLTSIQMSAGGGPDIINGILMRDYIEGMLEKGTLEDMSPYMAASGIREEDYFPLTFASLRQGEHIYGVNPSIVVWDTEISEEVLGSREVPDIEALADILLARNEKGVYRKGYDSAQVLESFLQGTESLWGMIDWENGSCDFDSPLFGKLLEAAKRYGDDGRTNLDSITSLSVLRNVLHFEGQAQQEAEGKVSFGVLFDDGCYPVSEWVYVLSINANSPHKEAAWEFIRFLISEEAQFEDSTSLSMPLHKEAFDAWMQKYIDKYTVAGQENGVGVPIYNGRAVTDEMQAEFRGKIEAARPLPIRTAPILDIILEEAKAYFDGYKNEQDVVAVINKRVQLYLDERK